MRATNARVGRAGSNTRVAAERRGPARIVGAVATPRPLSRGQRDYPTATLALVELSLSTIRDVWRGSPSSTFRLIGSIQSLNDHFVKTMTATAPDPTTPPPAILPLPPRKNSGACLRRPARTSTRNHRRQLRRTPGCPSKDKADTTQPHGGSAEMREGNRGPRKGGEDEETEGKAKRWGKRNTPRMLHETEGETYNSPNN